MGQCFLYGSGGKDRLVLRIFGQTSAPADPKNNDIWVNTSIPIGGWEFSEVSNPTWGTSISGFVYFTSTYSGAGNAATSTGLNFLKEWTHSIYTKLLQCRQYDGSSWIRKNAYIYHDGWHQFSAEWDGTLFDNGNQYTDVTGGWTGADSYSPNLEKTSDNLIANVDISTVNMIDLTAFNTLYFIGNGYGSNSGGHYNATAGVRNSSGWVASVSFQNNKTYSVDVSGLTGSYYVRFLASGSRGQYICISKVWLV